MSSACVSLTCCLGLRILSLYSYTSEAAWCTSRLVAFSLFLASLVHARPGDCLSNAQRAGKCRLFSTCMLVCTHLLLQIWTNLILVWFLWYNYGRGGGGWQWGDWGCFMVSLKWTAKSPCSGSSWISCSCGLMALWLPTLRIYYLPLLPSSSIHQTRILKCLLQQAVPRVKKRRKEMIGEVVSHHHTYIQFCVVI